MKNTGLFKALGLVAVATLSFATCAADKQDLSADVRNLTEQLSRMKADLERVQNAQSAPPPQEVLHSVDASFSKSWSPSKFNDKVVLRGGYGGVADHLAAPRVFLCTELFDGVQQGCVFARDHGQFVWRN